MGFSLQWLLLFLSTGSRRAGFGSCGSWALEHRFSTCGAQTWLLYRMRILPEPVSPALAGRVLTTGPPGKSLASFLQGNEDSGYMTGVSSEKSSEFRDERADGGEEMGALPPEGNRTTGPFLVGPFLDSSFSSSWQFPHSYPLPPLPSSIFPEYFHFIQLNFSDDVL